MSFESPLQPDQPRDSGGPVFSQPWEAQIFSITLMLHQRGLFTWPEWTHALGAEIASGRSRGDADLGDTYYRYWVAALERLLGRKGVISSPSQPGT
jgi:nitrile hydratase accessory protein